MYSRSYPRNRNPISSKPRSRCRGDRNKRARRHPWYTSSTCRSRASERDRRFFPTVDPAKEKDRIQPTVEDNENDQPQVEKINLNSKLCVTDVDLHIGENAKAHHTNAYQCSDVLTRDREKDGSPKKAELVIRRGQEFKITITFNRPYDVKKNDIVLLFNLGDDYKPKKQLSATFRVDEIGDTSYKPRKWGATVDCKEGNKLTLLVFVPANVAIGEWELSIKTIVDIVGGKDIVWQYNHTADYINIIFNPWCKEDLVYMEDEDWRNETVLNTCGAQYNGSCRKVSCRSWNFGQFDDGILDTALHLVRKGFGYKACSAMASPAKVARILSSIVNSPGDDGVLCGNWSGTYTGGVKPTAWNGSVKILKQYADTCKPVKYGQCWVFSAVVTTVCRAIGLPCRSVTNFASAHNTDLDRLSIDVIKKKDKDGSWVDDKSDSVWNFHVWNEVWMRRPDLKEGNEYDGWQVIDATPQELSDGVYCCGPSPVKAIMKGELDIGNDTAFIYAEVNADRVTWKENEKSGRLFEVRRRRNAVGKFISTHKPTGKPFEGKTFGSFLSFFGFSDDLEREDLTDHYKHKEGSEEEKKVNRKAEKLFRQLNGCESEDESDPECEEEEPIELEIEEDPDVLCGNGFDFKIKAKNNGSKTRTMNLELKVLYKTYYDTVTGVALAKSFKEINMKPGDSKSFKVEVSDKLANQRPQDGFCFELKADAEFTETSNIVSEEVDYRLRRPDLTVKGPKKVSLDEIVNVTVSLRNPLKVPLTGCEVDFEGGFKPHGRTKNTFKVSNIQPGSTWETSLQLKASAHPVTCAYRDLNIGFDSNELQDIMGVYSCTVTNLS